MICTGLLPAYAQTTNETGNLTFEISGLKTNEGEIVVMLYRKDDKIPGTPFRQETSKITDKKALIAIQNLAFGEYAAIIVHDENANGIIDHKWGMPSEPLLYTNQWKFTLFSGMPSFNKLRFAFSKEKNLQKINF
jgi:uncharacterized protein (DUF2141 family)